MAFRLISAGQHKACFRLCPLQRERYFPLDGFEYESGPNRFVSFEERERFPLKVCKLELTRA